MTISTSRAEPVDWLRFTTPRMAARLNALPPSSSGLPRLPAWPAVQPVVEFKAGAGFEWVTDRPERLDDLLVGEVDLLPAADLRLEQPANDVDRTARKEVDRGLRADGRVVDDLRELDQNASLAAAELLVLLLVLQPTPEGLVADPLHRVGVEVADLHVGGAFAVEDLVERGGRLIAVAVVTVDHLLFAPLAECPAATAHATTAGLPAGVMSQPTQRRPICAAISPHRPVPANGSAMNSPGSVKFSIRNATPPLPCAHGCAERSRSELIMSVTSVRPRRNSFTYHSTGFDSATMNLPGSRCARSCFMVSSHQ